MIQGIWWDSAWLGCLRTKSSLGKSPNILAIGWNLPDYKRIPWSIPCLWKLTKKVETKKKNFTISLMIILNWLDMVSKTILAQDQFWPCTVVQYGRHFFKYFNNQK